MRDILITQIGEVVVKRTLSIDECKQSEIRFIKDRHRWFRVHVPLVLRFL